MFTTFDFGRAITRPAGFCSVAAVVLGAALWTNAGDPPSAAGLRGVDPLAIMPSGTVAAAVFNGEPCSKYSKELGLSKIFHSPEFQAFIAPALEFAKGFEGMAGSHLPLPPRELADLLMSGRTVFGLTKVAFEKENRGDFKAGVPSVGFLLGVNTAGRRKDLEKIVAWIEAEIIEKEGGPPPTEVDLGGPKGKRIPISEGDDFKPFNEIVYVVVDDWLLVGSDSKELAASLARMKSGTTTGSLVEDAAYKTFAAEATGPKTVFNAYMSWKAYVGALTSMMPSDDAKIFSSPVMDMSSIGWATDLDGLAVRDRFYAGMSASMRGLYSKVDQKKMLALAPKSSLAFYDAAFNLTALLDGFAAMPQVAKVLPKIESAIEKRVGLSLRRDVLTAFGPTFAGYVSMPRHGLIPDFGLMAQAPDPAKADAILKKLIEASGVAVAGPRFTHGGVEVRTINISPPPGRGGPPLMLRPCWFYAEDMLVFTPWPQAARNFIDHLTAKDGGLAASEAFGPAWARFAGRNQSLGDAGLGYFDLPTVAGVALETLMPFIQSAALPGMVPLDLGLFPPPDVFTSNLVPFLMGTSIKESGAVSEMSSPTGFLALETVLIGAAAAVAFEEMSARVPRGATEITPAGPHSRPSKEMKDEDEDGEEEDGK